VYVFALLAHQDKPTLDPLNVAQWVFYVVPTLLLDDLMPCQNTIALNALDALSGGAVGYHLLKEKIANLNKP
jgi:hypothetical protein